MLLWLQYLCSKGSSLQLHKHLLPWWTIYCVRINDQVVLYWSPKYRIPLALFLPITLFNKLLLSLFPILLAVRNFDMTLLRETLPDFLCVSYKVSDYDTCFVFPWSFQTLIFFINISSFICNKEWDWQITESEKSESLKIEKIWMGGKRFLRMDKWITIPENITLWFDKQIGWFRIWKSYFDPYIGFQYGCQKC